MNAAGVVTWRLFRKSKKTRVLCAYVLYLILQLLFTYIFFSELFCFDRSQYESTILLKSQYRDCYRCCTRDPTLNSMRFVWAGPVSPKNDPHRFSQIPVSLKFCYYLIPVLPRLDQF